MLEQRLAGLLELFESVPVRLFIIIGPLDKGFARDVITTCNLGRVEGSIVHPPRWLVYPSPRDALHDHVKGSLERHGQVDRDEAVELVRLAGGAGKTVKEEGRGRVVRRAAEGARGRGHEGSHLVVVGRVVGLTLGAEGRGLEGHDLWPTQPSSLVQLIADEAEDDAVRDQGTGFECLFDLNAYFTQQRSWSVQ